MTGCKNTTRALNRSSAPASEAELTSEPGVAVAIAMSGDCMNTIGNSDGLDKHSLFPAWWRRGSGLTEV